MRQAPAATREMLAAPAAGRLGASPDDFPVAESKVTHSPSARHFTFGQLAADAAKEQVPARPKLRARNELHLIGQWLDRMDVTAKVNGSARCGFDLEAPDIRYAAFSRGPGYGSPITRTHDANAKPS